MIIVLPVDRDVDDGPSINTIDFGDCYHGIFQVCRFVAV